MPSLISSLESGISALKSFTKGIEVIGNNIANINTYGFKSARVDYTDSFNNLLRHSSPSPAASTGSNVSTMQVGGGVQIGSISSKFTQGQVSKTGFGTDLAIVGEGFFLVNDSSSSASFATRAGNFRVDDRGYIVNIDGFRLHGLTGGAIEFDVTDSGTGDPVYAVTTGFPTTPAILGDLNVDFSMSVGAGLNDLTGGSILPADIDAKAPTLAGLEINEFGLINMLLSNGESFDIGRIFLVDFNDPNALERQGNGLYTGFDAAGLKNPGALIAEKNGPQSNGLGKIQSRALELSNVDLTEEFANIISMQRSFQAGARIITISDDILEEIVNLKR